MSPLIVLFGAVLVGWGAAEIVQPDRLSRRDDGAGLPARLAGPRLRIALGLLMVAIQVALWATGS